MSSCHSFQFRQRSDGSGVNDEWLDPNRLEFTGLLEKSKVHHVHTCSTPCCFPLKSVTMILTTPAHLRGVVLSRFKPVARRCPSSMGRGIVTCSSIEQDVTVIGGGLAGLACAGVPNAPR